MINTRILLTRALSCSALAAGLVLTGCPAGDDAGAKSDSGVQGQTDGAPTGGADSKGNSESDSGINSSGPDSSDTDNPPTNTSFLLPIDGGGTVNECDLWAQDCGEGDKCMPWANDGGGSWNATKCTPISVEAGQPGDVCTVEGSGVSGIDSCAESGMCWGVDGETNQGYCVGFCEGSESNPLCSDPNTGCSITNDGVLILCLSKCDPIAQDCPSGEACYEEPNGFFCSPDASGPDQGMFGDPCGFLNGCDPGLWCANAELVPDCAGGDACCSTYCDVTEPQCESPLQTCTRVYEKGAAPPGYEDAGVCVIPQ